MWLEIFRLLRGSYRRRIALQTLTADSLSPSSFFRAVFILYCFLYRLILELKWTQIGINMYHWIHIYWYTNCSSLIHSARLRCHQVQLFHKFLSLRRVPMSYLCLFADPNIGRSPSPIYHVVQNACWQEYETACIAGLSYLQIAKCIC